MRNLTIKRTKSFVACLAKMKVYVSDAAGDTVIDGTACRYLGDLKNGEEKTFQVGCEAQSIYVIAGKTSKGFCSELYELAAGEEDVTLTGRNRFDMTTGNAFRFDGNDSAAAVANRSKTGKKGVIVLCIAAALGVCIGVFNNMMPAGPATFTNSGMTITLTDDFIKQDMDGFDACYGAEDVAVFAFKEPFDTLGAESAEEVAAYTSADYGELFISANTFSALGGVQTKDGLTYVEYTADGVDYFYRAYIYKTDDAFWVVQFAVDEADKAEYADDFVTWANSVSFE